MLIQALGLAGMGALVADEIPSPDRSVIFKTVPGKESGEVKLRLHLFLPEGHQPADRRPAIVFFFSGGWNTGSPAQFFPHCDYFASRGIVAMSAEYRVRSRHGTSPQECVKDGKSAIRWIRRHQGELGIDPDRLAAGGGSAGGHVAAAAATLKKFNEVAEDREISCLPNALVLFNPAIDNGPRVVVDRPPGLPERDRAGWGYDRVGKYWRDFSPMHNIDEKTPPTIIFLGTQDKFISTASVEEFERRMTNKGNRCELRLYPGQPHEFYNVENRKNYIATVIEADRFLASLGFLKGEPTLRQDSPLPPDSRGSTRIPRGRIGGAD